MISLLLRVNGNNIINIKHQRFDEISYKRRYKKLGREGGRTYFRNRFLPNSHYQTKLKFWKKSNDNRAHASIFKERGAKIVLYLVSPGGTSMMGAGGEIVVFWFSRTQENAFPDTLLRYAMAYLKMRHSDLRKIFICQQKIWVAMAPRLHGPWTIKSHLTWSSLSTSVIIKIGFIIPYIYL